MSASRLAVREGATAAEVVREALLDPGRHVVVPPGESAMRPSLLPGDLLEVVPFLGLPRPGQIVVATISGRATALRLHAVELFAGRRRYWLRGDAPASIRQAVHRESLLGRVGSVVRHGLRTSVDDLPAGGPEPVGR